MARRPTTFRQRDMTAAIKAAVAAGCSIARVEVGKDGKIIVIVASKEPQLTATNEWDEILDADPADLRP